jgi:hypothetical protein
MALTAACARCHDHKYDPIPTRDYYSLYGVFNSCAEQLVNLGPEPTDKDFVAKARKLADTMRQRREEAGGPVAQARRRSISRRNSNCRSIPTKDSTKY